MFRKEFRSFCKYLILIMLSRTGALAFRSSSRGNVRTTSSFYTPRRCETKMSKEDSYFISTPIYYVNGRPHLGHAYTSVAADVIARFKRNEGKNVIFLTGTDEHGQKVEQSALAAQKTPIIFADEVSASFKMLAEKLKCSHDIFIRTTEDRHIRAVQSLWERLELNGQIYLGAYEGWYSVRDEAFYSETELIDGKAPTGAPVEWVKEESYFFKLSDWTEKLLKFYEQNPEFIGPKGRRNEVVSFVGQQGGLKDLSVSRTTFSWGIPVPSNPKHVVYVWLDALANYITAVGYPDTTHGSPFKAYWPADLHIVGKDILRFHAVFWPAFLMAAGLEPPKRIFAHGWWTKDGEKMSKSIGNVVDPFELIDRYGVEYVRYFLASEIIFGNDGDFSHDSFVNRVNSDLANDIGNLLQRTLTLIQKHCNGIIPDPASPTADFILTAQDVALFDSVGHGALDAISHEVTQNQNLKGLCDLIVGGAKLGNRYIDTEAPWKLCKTDMPRFRAVMFSLAETMRRVAILLSSVIPAASENILEQLGISSVEARSFASLGMYGSAGCVTLQPTPVFPKLDPATLPPLKPVSHTPSVAPSGLCNESAISGEFSSLDDIAKAIKETANQLREMKATAKFSKEDLKPSVDKLLDLKARYKEANGGVAYPT